MFRSRGMTRQQSACYALRTLAVGGTILAATVGAVEAAQSLRPSAVVASRETETLYVALADVKQIALVSLDSHVVTGSYDMPAEPTGLALGPGGRELYATCGGAESKVLVIDTASGRTTAAIAVGHTAMGPAVTPDGKRLYVCNRFDNDVSVIDLEACTEVARLPVVREPVASAVTPDGRSVLVANHLPAGRSDAFYATAVITVIDVRTHQTTPINLPNGSVGLRGLCISPDGRHAYVTHILANYELVPAQVVGGWTNTNVLSVVDTVQKRLVNTVLLDEAHLGAANPWGVAFSSDGRWLCVAHAGTDEISVIDAEALLETLYNGIYVAPPASGIPNSPSILTGLRRRIKLPGKGARTLAVMGSTAYVAEHFSDSLALVDLEQSGGAQAGAIALGPRPQPTARQRGEILFNDATICYQHWQSCASCHPDARVDGLNWDLLNDGVGNPKNTKSMLLAHRTPPAMSWGARPSAESAVRSGLAHILFADQPDEDATAIDEYLKSLRPMPSPHVIDGRLSPAARRGKLLFESEQVGCYRCHPPPTYTDLLVHDMGTRGPFDHRARFDTPTLVEVWRTAPYLHDGRYVTVEELITEGKHGNTHGRVDRLDAHQIHDLVEFVLSL